MTSKEKRVLKAQLGNFNVVFGEEERPMLDYFDSIIFPALNCGIEKKTEDAIFSLKNVMILQNNAGEDILVGKYVKQTKVEILSDVDSSGMLIEKDETYSSAPYSTFIINLKNHRLLFIPNQKGSPMLSSFKTMMTYVIYNYINIENKTKEEETKLPEPVISIVPIPGERSIKKILEDAKKVTKLELRFYPLNGDIDMSGVFFDISKEIRRELGCKTGGIVFNSPRSVEGITKVVTEANGTIEPIIDIVSKDNSKLKIKDEGISETYELQDIGAKDFDTESKQMVKASENIKPFNFSTPEHEAIYKKNAEKIVHFRKKDEL